MNEQRNICVRVLALWISITLLPRAVKLESSRFIAVPLNTTAIAGDTVEFECLAAASSSSPQEDLQYSWTFNGIAIPFSNEDELSTAHDKLSPSSSFKSSLSKTSMSKLPLSSSMSHERRISKVGSNLRIVNVHRQDDIGDYACIVTSRLSGARQATAPAHLSVIWIQSAAVHVLSRTDTELVLRCHIEGSSAGGMFEIEWFQNSLKLSTLRNVELTRDLLVIHNPSVRDAGMYRCTASNAAGRVISNGGFILHTNNKNGNKDREHSKSITQEQLKEEYAKTKCAERKQYKHDRSIDSNDNSNSNRNPRNAILCRGKRGDDSTTIRDIKLLDDQSNGREITMKENQSVRLPCRYSLPDHYRQSATSVQLLWRKDNKLLRQQELNHNNLATDHQIDQIGMTTTTMEPTSPNKELVQLDNSRVSIDRESGSIVFNSLIASDEGQYQCQIIILRDGQQQSLSTGQIAVTSTPIILHVIEQLKFMPQPTSKNLELGSLGKVHCKAQGTPTPQITWTRVSETGFVSQPLPPTVEDINGTLIFRNVSMENRGNYTCLAINTQGQINATVSVNVVVAPRFTVAPQGPIEVAENEITAMHCQAIGDPKPTIQWDKDLKYLSENNTDRERFRFLENGTLEILNIHADDEGRYGCTIGNSAGLKREEVHLIIKGIDSFNDEVEGGFLITRAVLITMTVAMAYIVLVVGLMIWCRYRRQARKARLNEAAIKENLEAGGGGGVGDDGDAKYGEHEPCLPSNGGGGVGERGMNKSNGHPRSGNRSDDTACSKSSKRSQSLDQLSLSRTALTELILTGRGEFGDVFIGKVKAQLISHRLGEKEDHNGDDLDHGDASSNSTGTVNNAEKRRSKTSMDNIEEIKEEDEDEDGKDAETESSDTKSSGANGDSYKLVLVKALNKTKEESVCLEFRRQIEMYRAISHRGVVRLFGLCKEKEPHYMVLEHTNWGDLKQFLLATAGKTNTSAGSNNSPPPLKTDQILAVAYQIARGMDAIYRARFIHKDLATRNCVISSDFIVKVSAASLCKDKYSKEYVKHRHTLLPIRWMAPECIREPDEYTTKSDVFAFGVLVWELFTQATRLPFEELTNEQFLQQNQTIENGLNWQCADGTPEGLQEILTSCWRTNPKERPSFSNISAALNKAMRNVEKQ